MKLLKMVPDHTNIDFMRWRNFALILSLIVTIISIAFTFYRGLNLGVDFVGGQMVRVTFPQAVNVEQLREKVDGAAPGRSGSRNSAARGRCRSACPSRRAAMPPPTSPQRA